MGSMRNLGCHNLSSVTLAHQELIAQRPQTPRHQWPTCQQGSLAVLPSVGPDKVILRLAVDRLPHLVI
jgi:hypothetical protein